MIIRSKAYPRAGLIGNPSDGYFGKTIAFTFDNFLSEVVLYQSPELEILPARRDHSRFASIAALDEDVRRNGYYGGIRLLKATIRRFYRYCRDNGVVLDDRNFTLSYSSTIPGQVGLAGSSAIITACMRALMAFFQVEIPNAILAGIVLSVENDELGIPAGLQDRVAQAYQGLVYMDFDRGFMERNGFGDYAPLNPGRLPPVYIAYMEGLSEGTEVFHNDIRGRFERGERDVVEAMDYWAGLTVEARRAIDAGDAAQLARLIDANFDRRRSIYRIADGNLAMVEAARSVGASAKFAGSGGAIVGTYDGEDMFDRLRERLAQLDVRVFKPNIV